MGRLYSVFESSESRTVRPLSGAEGVKSVLFVSYLFSLSSLFLNFFFSLTAIKIAVWCGFVDDDGFLMLSFLL